MKRIITTTFKQGSDASLSAIARRVVNNVKSDNRFSALADAITTVEKALNEYDTALCDAGGGERALIAIKNSKRAVLRSLLGDLAISVQQLSKSDESMILSSGFDVNKDRDSPSQKLVVLTVDVGLPGEATTHIPRVRGSRAYIHQYTTDPLTTDSAWKSEASKSSRYNFKGLPSGVKCWFRVVIFDKGGNSTYLAPVARIIQ